MKQLAFSFDHTRCAGCFACVVACQDQNDVFGDHVAFRQVVVMEPEDAVPAPLVFFSISCFHCGEAPCLTVCPTGAIHQRDGVASIEVDRALCIGCRSCLSVCPFGAPRFADDGKMAKCDMCSRRQARGQEPACVRVCPTRALKAVPLEEISKEKAERSSRQMLNSGYLSRL